MQPAYVESRSALNRPLLACALSWYAAGAGCLIVMAAAGQQWLAPVAGALVIPAMAWTGLLYRNWPTGIRIDGSAVSIGAIGRARPPRRPPTAFRQSQAMFTCPWPAVTGMRVVTDQAELRQMTDSPAFETFTNRWGGRRLNGKGKISHCNTGVLISPFMRAALVLDIYPAAVTATPVRPARLYSNGQDGRFSRLVQPRLSPTWIVPTRHPEALRRALETMPGQDSQVSRLPSLPAGPRAGRPSALWPRGAPARLT